MNFKNVSLLIVFAALVAGCSGEKQASPSVSPDAPPDAHALRSPPPGTAVMTVNGETITEELLTIFARGHKLDAAVPEQRQQALDLLVDTLLLAQDAIATGLAAKPETQGELALVGMQQLAAKALAGYREQVNVGDAELRAFYDREAKRAGAVQLHLQNILFADQATALEASTRAAKPGADFDALMTEYAAKGAKQAKDMGWGNLGQYPDALGQAALTLKDGEAGAVPVQTEFGWHVFKRVASRPFTPPAFEEVKERARKQVADEALADKAKALKEKATIVEAHPATVAK